MAGSDDAGREASACCGPATYVTRSGYRGPVK